MIIKTAGKTLEVVGNIISINESITGKQKTIPINNVTSIQIKKPGLTGGYFYLQTIGGLNNSRMKTPNDFIKDENTIIINSKKKYQVALQIKEYIEKAQTTLNSGNQVSNADELIKYKQLLDGGAISQEEFEEKKKQLLGNGIPRAFVSNSTPSTQYVKEKTKKKSKLKSIGLIYISVLIIGGIIGIIGSQKSGNDVLTVGNEEMEKEIKSNPLEFDEKAWKDFLKLYKNHNDFMSTMNSYSEGEISDLAFYDYCKKVDEISAEASLSFKYGKTKEEKEYLSTFEIWALSHQQAGKNLIKYIDSNETKDLSKAKEAIERAQEAATVIAGNRVVLLRSIGLAEDEINKRIDEGLAEIEALDTK